jgi:small subunit ribosomal protein S17e
MLPTFQTLEKHKRLTWRKIHLGKVKTEQIKHLGKELMARFPNKFTTDFDENKRLVDALTKGTTTRVRNQVAGYITRTISLAHSNSEIEPETEEPEAAE